MKKFKNRLLCALFSVLAFTTAITPTFAMSNDQVQSTKSFDESNLRQNLQKLDIDKKTQDKIIAKAKKGELWDSQNPKMLAKVPKQALTPSLEGSCKKIRVS